MIKLCKVLSFAFRAADISFPRASYNRDLLNIVLCQMKYSSVKGELSKYIMLFHGVVLY